MIEIAVADAKLQIAALLDRVLQGEQVSITDAGRTVVEMVPHVIRERTPEEIRSIQEAVASIERRAFTLEGDFSWEEMKKLRDFGRP